MKITTKRKILKKIFCDILPWHKASKLEGFDGMSFKSTCVRCGRKVLQDSQGNWFTYNEG